MLLTNAQANKVALDNFPISYKLEIKKGNNTIIVPNEDIETPINYTSGLEGIPLGFVPISEMTVVLRGQLAKSYYEEDSYEMSLTIIHEEGEIKSKQFVAETPTYDERTLKTTIKGKDKILQLVSVYEKLDVAYPITLGKFINKFCSVHGLQKEIVGGLFNENYVLRRSPNLDDDYSNKDLLEGISKMTLSYIYLDFQGKLKIQRLSNLMSKLDYTITEGVKDLYFNRDRYKTLGVNTMIIGLHEGIDGDPSVRKDQAMIDVDGQVPIELYDIPFLLEDTDREAVVQSFLNEIKGFKYKSYDLDSKYWFFDLGDVVKYEGISYPVLQINTNHNISAMTNISAFSEDYVTEEYDVSRFTSTKKTGIKIDRVNQQILNYVSDISDFGDKLVQQEMTVDQIKSTVSSMAVGQNLIPNLNSLIEIFDNKYPYWTFDIMPLLPRPKLYPNKRLFPMSKTSPNYLMVNDTNSISGRAKEYVKKGKAYSGNAYIVPDTVYSYRCKRTLGNKPFDVWVIEKKSDLVEIKRTKFVFDGQNTVETLTFTPAQNTMYASLMIETSDSTVFRIAEEMFTRGNPSNWVEDSNDIKVWAESQFLMTNSTIDLLSRTVTGQGLQINDVSIKLNSVEATVGINAQKIDNINGDIHNAGVEINAVEGVGIYGKKFKVMNEQRDKTVFEVVTVDGQEQVNMVGSIQSEGGSIEFDSKNKRIKIGDVEIKSWAGSANALGIYSNQITLVPSSETANMVGITLGNSKTSTSSDWALYRNLTDGLVTLRTDTIRARTALNDYVEFNRLKASNDVVANSVVVGRLMPDSNNPSTKTIGDINNRFANIYLQNQPNVSSDIRSKYNVSKIDDLLLDEFEKVEEKFFITKHDDMFSFGYIAQDVERALYKFCLNVYGWDHANDWLKKFKLLNKSESYMSLLYNEVQIIKQAVKQRKIDRANDRIEQLESQLEESVKQHDELRREFDTLIGILKEGGHI